MNTRKIFFLVSFLAVVFCASAQTQIDNSLAQMSQTAYNSLSLSQTNPLFGTARYTGMGGAMGALGGDATSMKDNPAGIGIYRKSDLTLTPNVYIDNDNSVGFNINNFAFILNFGNSGKTEGYVTSSFGVGYNRLKNFSRTSILNSVDLERSMTDYMYAAGDYFYDDACYLNLLDENDNSKFGFDSEGKPMQLNNQVRYVETGSMGEWNFSYGINISNLIHFGISLGIVNVNYKLKTNYDEFTVEDYEMTVKKYLLFNFMDLSSVVPREEDENEEFEIRDLFACIRTMRRPLCSVRIR